MTDSTAPSLPVVRLKIERKSGHPWIYQKMVERPSERLPPGTVVEIHDRNGQWCGRGFYNGHSRITLRVLTSDANEPVDQAFFANKLRQAISLRRDVLKLDEVTNAYRLVHSEGDGLSGLVIDRFGSVIVIEFFAAGMYRFRQTIIDVLTAEFPGSQFYWFAEDHVGKQESIDVRSPEPPAPQVIEEHGVKFRVAPGSKHKTGFFVDQRDNRKLFSELCAGQRVLDLCCNTGGFGVYAKARGKADEVIGVDLDESVIELAKQNAKLNNAQIRFIQADLFTWLRDVIPNGERFGAVVLDPAKLTRDREDVLYALKKYTDMNRVTMHAIKPGGLLLTCSCTGLVSEADFLEMLRRAAWQAQRQVQIVKVSGAGGDHPYMAHVPESRYLKAVFCRVL